MAAELHISIAAEPVFHIGDFPVTNSLITTYVVMAVLLLVALSVAASPSVTLKSGKKIKKAPAFLELVIGGFYNFLSPILGKKIDTLFPLVFTFFLFILMGNWIGLLPGVGPLTLNHVPLFRGPNADLSTTLSLALVSVSATQVLSVRALGFGSYIKKFIDFSNPVNFFVGILEIVSEFAKILSFSFRLFGNIFAGEVLLVVITFLVPLLLPIPFLGLEIFVGFIQALVFTMLTSVFIAVSTEHH